jgi:putative transposase
VKKKFYRVKSHAEIPQSRQLAPTIAEIKEKVCRCYGVKQQALEKTKRGQVNEPRNIAIYLTRKRSSLAFEIIGREFGLEKYSSVSSIATRTEEQLLKDKNMQNRFKERGRMIKKSQAKI